MASGALFSSNGRSQSKNLVEFRAGKMKMDGKMVNPDARKGMLYVHQSEDSLIHFCWRERNKSSAEDDLIIFPDDCEFKEVPQCTTGRAFLLKFKTSSRKFFFWSQEPKSDKDAEYVRKINDVLNNPPPLSSSGGNSSSDLVSALGESGDFQNLLGSMNQQQLMQQLIGMGMGGYGNSLGPLLNRRSNGGQSATDSPLPSRISSASSRSATDTVTRSTTASSNTTSTTTTATTPTTPAIATTTAVSSVTPVTPLDNANLIQLSDLQNILTDLRGDDAKQKEEVDLSEGAMTEAMIPLLINSDVRDRLLAFLPDSQDLPKSEDELRSTLKSPQFQQALQSFSVALSSGQLGPLITQFGLDENASKAAAEGDVVAFSKALQEALKKKDESME